MIFMCFINMGSCVYFSYNNWYAKKINIENFPIQSLIMQNCFIVSVSPFPTLSFPFLLPSFPTVWVAKTFPFFETRYRATVILRSVFISVPFYNFPCFYCCVSILKVWCKERLKNGKKNGAKNGVKTATQRVFSTALFSNYCTVPLCLYNHSTDRTDGI